MKDDAELLLLSTEVIQSFGFKFLEYIYTFPEELSILLTSFAGGGFHWSALPDFFRATALFRQNMAESVMAQPRNRSSAVRMKNTSR